MSTSPATLLFTASDIRAIIDVPACIDVVEAAFARQGVQAAGQSGVLTTAVLDGGFHVKSAADGEYYVAKVNANFPRNPHEHHLPTVQGVVGLFDTACGSLLALMDSAEITAMRTAAATAVATRYLSRPDAKLLTIIGCGVQGRYHILALTALRPIRRVHLVDRDPAVAEQLAREVARDPSLDVRVLKDAAAAASMSDIVVTCTPASQPILGVGDLPADGFVAAVGADSPGKQEIDAHALARCTVVVDVLEQCAVMGELHHALSERTMTREDVYATLPGIVRGEVRVPEGSAKTVVFDSTGAAFEDIAAASLVYQRGRQLSHQRQFRLTD